MITIILITILSLSVIGNIIFLAKNGKVKKIKNVYNQRINNLTKLEAEAEKIIVTEKHKYTAYKNDLIDEYKSKLSKVKNSVFGSIRKGYYEHPLTYDGDKFTTYVYVDEVDRYTNGKSKIKIDYIEAKLPIGASLNFVREYLDKTFVSLVDTNDVTWLESVDEISKERSKKLERILKDEK
jgi:outer membrane lipoprotein-sorting protein